MRRRWFVFVLAGVVGLVGAGNASATPSVSISGPASLAVGATGVYNIVVTSDVGLTSASINVSIGGNAVISAFTNTPPAALSAVTFQVTPPIPNGTSAGAWGGIATGGA